ncbi:hypothetical protein SCB49_04110 [unidentified eubacterium SCB49]|nr:hypothetical protein SCB49_04110 [unidentified eubacterium SCB49]
MKIKFLLFSVVLAAFSANAQYTVKDAEGNEINDGDLIAVNSFADEGATITFFVTNDTGATIRSSVEYVSTDVGGEIQLCYGAQCYDAIEVGNSYPPANSPQIIEAGATTGPGNHFMYNEITNPQYSNHEFRFYLVDESGADIGNDLNFTFRYDPDLGLDAVQSQLGITMESTMIGNTIALSSQKNATMQIFDINGRLMQTNLIESGAQNIDVSGLASQLYIVNFKGLNGESQSIKVLKK